MNSQLENLLDLAKEAIVYDHDRAQAITHLGQAVLVASKREGDNTYDIRLEKMVREIIDAGGALRG